MGSEIKSAFADRFVTWLARQQNATKCGLPGLVTMDTPLPAMTTGSARRTQRYCGSQRTTVVTELAMKHSSWAA